MALFFRILRETSGKGIFGYETADEQTGLDGFFGRNIGRGADRPGHL
jgi:hypothetical protein